LDWSDWPLDDVVLEVPPVAPLGVVGAGVGGATTLRVMPA